MGNINFLMFEIYQADEVMLKDLTSAKGKLLNGKTGIVIRKLNNGRIEVTSALTFSSKKCTS